MIVALGNLTGKESEEIIENITPLISNNRFVKTDVWEDIIRELPAYYGLEWEGVSLAFWVEYVEELGKSGIYNRNSSGGIAEWERLLLIYKSIHHRKGLRQAVDGL